MKIKDGDKWGVWTIRLENYVLHAFPYPNKNIPYEIDLEEVRSFADIGEWLLHIDGKSFGAEYGNDLLKAFSAIYDGRQSLNGKGMTRDELKQMLGQTGDDE